MELEREWQGCGAAGGFNGCAGMCLSGMPGSESRHSINSPETKIAKV